MVLATLIFFLCFCNFLNYDFLKTTKDMLIQSYLQRLFSVNEHIEENTSRNPEFNYDRFELADMDNSECKANFILKA